jgi:predicted permease
MTIITTIIPIFTVIAVGWIFHRKGLIPSTFMGPANALVFYLAIPAMVFNAISKASLKTYFDLTVLLITLFSVLAGFGISYLTGNGIKIKGGKLGTFIQTSFHGNLGYIGLAVAYYYLGREGFVRAGILTGFMMILQNLLAVFALVSLSEEQPENKSRFSMLRNILVNPVILSAMAGILCSLTGLRMPTVVERSLEILSGMALPLALLIIGASLSFDLMRLQYRVILLAGTVKLLVLPGLGFILYKLFGLTPREYLPGLILLASPTATVSYIMAKEMRGDPDFAVVAISAVTLFSCLTFILWLMVSGL